MPKKPETTFDLVLKEVEPAFEYEPDVPFAAGAAIYIFAAFWHPSLNTDEQTPTLPPGVYVVYRGAAKFDKKGMTLPRSLTRGERFKVPTPQFVPAAVEKL